MTTLTDLQTAVTETEDAVKKVWGHPDYAYGSDALNTLIDANLKAKKALEAAVAKQANNIGKKVRDSLNAPETVEAIATLTVSVIDKTLKEVLPEGTDTQPHYPSPHHADPRNPRGQYGHQVHADLRRPVSQGPLV